MEIKGERRRKTDLETDKNVKLRGIDKPAIRIKQTGNSRRIHKKQCKALLHKTVTVNTVVYKALHSHDTPLNNAEYRMQGYRIHTYGVPVNINCVISLYCPLVSAVFYLVPTTTKQLE